jgi:hypothetical protein
MIGNAVPVEFAYRLALQIKSDLENTSKLKLNEIKEGIVVDVSEKLELIEEEQEIEC